MSQARIDYMQESAWKRNSAKKMRPMPPFELPYAKDAILIDLPEPDLLPDAHVNFLEMIELRSTLRQYDDTKELTKKEVSSVVHAGRENGHADKNGAQRSVRRRPQCTGNILIHPPRRGYQAGALSLFATGT